MSEVDELIVAVAMIVLYLVGPAALWRITKEAADWILLILVLVWAL